MSPMLILKDGKPFATLGSPGGTRIFATLTQVVSRLIDHKMDLQDAVNAPRIFDCATNVVEYEKGENGIAEKEISALEALGHQVKAKSEYDLYFGGVQGVVFLEDGTLRGAADPRREGKAFEY